MRFCRPTASSSSPCSSLSTASALRCDEKRPRSGRGSLRPFVPCVEPVMNTSSAGAGCPNQVSKKTVDREKMHDAAARVRDEEEDVQRLEGERLHGEEVRSPELRAVVGTPSARLSYTLDSHKRWSRKGGPVTVAVSPPAMGGSAVLSSERHGGRSAGPRSGVGDESGPIAGDGSRCRCHSRFWRTLVRWVTCPRYSYHLQS